MDLMKRSSAWRWGFGVALALLVGGCASMVPVPEPGHTTASDRYGSTQEAGALQVTARVVGWSDPLDRLEPYVTPFYLQIRNNGTEPVPFNLSGVTLVDDEGTLYRPLPPERLEALLVGGGTPVRPRNETLMQGYPYDTDIAATLGALTDGTVMPGTQIRGAVYFQRITRWKGDFLLRLTQPPLEFRFRVR